MRDMEFGEAIDRAVAAAMAADERVIVLGEDVPMLRGALVAQFGAERVLGAPISEAGFVGAGVGAAMAGLRPVVEVMLVDFIGVAMDAVLNQMAKVEFFSGGQFKCPIVLRCAVGGGYGDGGQHEQCLWGMLAGIPGIQVVVPCNPADAAGLMASAIASDQPVIFLEHKLLSSLWLESMGIGGRNTVAFDVPAAGCRGTVAEPIASVAIGEAAQRRKGTDLTIVSLGVGVHRSLSAAQELEGDGISAEVIDLRTVRPLDRSTVAASVRTTGRLLVVDEDYREFGLSGELAASMLEAALRPAFARVCVDDTLPYARSLEESALPNVDRIVEAARRMANAD